jgi:hypothetical protein
MNLPSPRQLRIRRACLEWSPLEKEKEEDMCICTSPKKQVFTTAAVLGFRRESIIAVAASRSRAAPYHIIYIIYNCINSLISALRASFATKTELESPSPSPVGQNIIRYDIKALLALLQRHATWHHVMKEFACAEYYLFLS